MINYDQLLLVFYENPDRICWVGGSFGGPPASQGRRSNRTHLIDVKLVDAQLIGFAYAIGKWSAHFGGQWSGAPFLRNVPTTNWLTFN